MQLFPFSETRKLYCLVKANKTDRVNAAGRLLGVFLCARTATLESRALERLRECQAEQGRNPSSLKIEPNTTRNQLK